MSLKTIKVNPSFLGPTGKGLKQNKTRKEKPSGISLGKTNNIKKKLIARVKDFQKNKNTFPNANANANANAINIKTDNTPKQQSIINDSFDESVQFLDNLARGNHDKKREKRERKLRTQRNSTIKQPHEKKQNAHMNIATELPPELDWNTIAPPAVPAPAVPAPAVPAPAVPAPAVTAPAVTAPAVTAPAVTAPAVTAPAVILAPPAAPGNWNSNSVPPYSNLKTGGSKPTYRTWLRNTQKNKHVIEPKHQTISILEDINTEIDTEPAAAPLVPDAAAPLAPDAAAPLAPDAAAPLAPAAHVYVPSMRPKRKRITRTLKYKLGKHADGKVSVLIKNAQTRRKVQTEQAHLKQKSILEIKNFLRSKNLLKAGSEAPNDVLRHLYEQSILAGLVENKSKENLIHNFFNNEK